jgi:hypothetical protein
VYMSFPYTYRAHELIKFKKILKNHTCSFDHISSVRNVVFFTTHSFLGI